MRRGPKIDLDATQVEKKGSTDAIAERFLDQLVNSAWESPKPALDPTIINVDPSSFQAMETRHEDQPMQHVRVAPRKNPILAGIISLLVPGAGFIYVGSYLVGLCFLFLVPAALLMFASYSGFVPAVRDSFRFIPTTVPLEHALLSTAVAAFFLIWLNLVIPISMANRTQMTRHDPHAFWVVLFSPVPILGPYVQRRYFLGHFQSFSIFLFLVAAVSSAVFWREGGTHYEHMWLATTLAGVVSAFGFGFGWFLSLAGGLRACGILAEPGSADSETKFILLGALVILLGGGYLLFGQPGQFLRKEIKILKSKLDQKGFQETSKFLLGL